MSARKAKPDSSVPFSITDTVSFRVRQALRSASSKKLSGFTLAELIVVVTILAVLAAIGFLALSGYSQDAKDSAAKANVRSVLSSIRAESAITWNSPRRYIVHDASLSWVALSWAFVEFSGERTYLTGGNWNAPNTNYTAGNPDWAALKLDSSKFRISSVPERFFRISDDSSAAFDSKSVILWAADAVTASASSRTRSVSFLQWAAILPSWTAYVTGDSPAFSSASWASSGLIRDPAQSSATWALVDAVSVSVPTWIQSSSPSYSVANSLRTEYSRNAYLSMTPPAWGSQTTWTISFWTKRSKLWVLQDLFWALSAVWATTELWFNASDQLFFAWNSYNALTSSAVFRDTAAFYHIVVTWDTNNSSPSDRARIYVNGKRLTMALSGSYPSAGLASYWNSSSLANSIWRYGSIGYDGYFSSIDFVDGQALSADSFGEEDPSTGSWKPRRFEGTYGTGGYRLDFSSWSTLASLWSDSSGKGNSFTPTAGTDLTDKVADSPTNVFPTLNPLEWHSSAPTLSSGNLKTTANAWAHQLARATQAFPKSGKWYWEVLTNTTASSMSVHVLGISSTEIGASWPEKSSTIYINNYGQAGNQNNLTFSNAGSVNVQTVNATYAQVAWDVLRFAYDADSGKFWIGANGSWFGSAGTFTGNPATWSNPVETLPSGYSWVAHSSPYWAQSSTFNFWQGGIAGALFDEAAGWSFKYSPPIGFKALSTANSPTPAISKPSQFFDILTYAGNGWTQTIGGLSFSPDFVWGKARNAIDAHWLFDTSRGPNKILKSDSNAWETTASTLTSFNPDGFGVDVNISQSGRNFVAWNWKKGALPWFDVVTYSGNGSNARQIPHSLGSVPKMYFTKNLDGYNASQSFSDWSTYHASLNQAWASNTNGPWCLWLHSPSVASSGAGGFGWIPTSSIFYPNQTAYDNVSGKSYVAYLWSEVPGFSKFWYYTGNGNANWPFVNTGFKPKFVLVKVASVTGDNWQILDSVRSPENVADEKLEANTTGVESVNNANKIDFLSNGFKIRGSDGGSNTNTAKYVYAAFAEVPFWGAWIAPATAK